MTIKPGGEAFPKPFSQFDIDAQEGAQEGMALRDHFAGMAMKAMLSSWPDSLGACDSYICNIAAISYQIAGAMLKSREVKE